MSTGFSMINAKTRSCSLEAQLPYFDTTLRQPSACRISTTGNPERCAGAGSGIGPALAAATRFEDLACDFFTLAGDVLRFFFSCVGDGGWAPDLGASATTGLPSALLA